MANVDNPRGFWPLFHLLGGEFRTMEFTTGGVVYAGDPVKAINDGTITVIAAGDTILGIAAEYAASGATCRVYVDPFIMFGVQATTGQTPAATDLFGTADMITYAAGNATTKTSIMELGAISTGSANFKVWGKINEPANAWGEHVDLMVTIYESFLISYGLPSQHEGLNTGI